MSAEQRVDLDETPQSRQRKKIAKEESARKAQPAEAKIAKVWYEKGGEKSNKLLKCTRMKSGNVYKEFVGMIDKNTKEQCAKLLKENPKPASED